VERRKYGTKLEKLVTDLAGLSTALESTMSKTSLKNAGAVYNKIVRAVNNPTEAENQGVQTYALSLVLIQLLTAK
jgi:hypothetical protein